MSSILFTNVTAILPDKALPSAFVLCERGKITSITQRRPKVSAQTQVIDGKGKYLSPGFVDIHVHGGDGHDFMDGTAEAMRGACVAHARHGTTTIFPTTTTGSPEQIHAMLKAAKTVQSEHRIVNGAGDDGSWLTSDGKVGWAPNGSLASSIMGMDHMVRQMKRDTSATLPEVIRMASLTPAELTGIGRRTRSINVGKPADLLLLNRDLRVKQVFIAIMTPLLTDLQPPECSAGHVLNHKSKHKNFCDTFIFRQSCPDFILVVRIHNQNYGNIPNPRVRRGHYWDLGSRHK